MHKGNPQVEEYLEAIYRKKEKGEDAKTNALANELGVSPASVSEMLRRLEQRGLLVHASYKLIELTRKGEAIGKKITRRHRLIEKFLALLGVRKNLHGEACVLEHAVSDEVERAMARFIRKGRRKRQ